VLLLKQSGRNSLHFQGEKPVTVCRAGDHRRARRRTALGAILHAPMSGTVREANERPNHFGEIIYGRKIHWSD